MIAVPLTFVRLLPEVHVAAFAACHPLWLSQIGYLQYSGMDLDRLCVDMARLNMRLYGLTPMRIEPVTLAALESRLEERAGPRALAYQAV